MTLKELRAVRERTIIQPGLDEFADALLAYLFEREGGPFEPRIVDHRPGPATNDAEVTT